LNTGNSADQYAWSVLSEQAKHHKVSLGSAAGATMTKPEKLTTQLWEKLEVMSNQSLADSLSLVSENLRAAKVSSISKKDLAPMIGVMNNKRVLVIPATLKTDPNFMGQSMLRYAQFLQYEIREFDYELTVEEEKGTETQREFGLAFYTSLDDVVQSVNCTSKSMNNRELVRKFVRAQQIIGFLKQQGHAPDCLKRNHRIFGNNPGEVETVVVGMNKTDSLKVPYFKSVFSQYYRETKWRHQLSEIFITLIKESFGAIPEEVLFNNVTDNIISLNDMMKMYCSSTEEIITGKGKAQVKKTVHTVPSKPKESPCYLKEETQILNELSASLFGKTYYELNVDRWPQIVLGSGFRQVKEELQEIYRNRSAYVRAFADSTTRRLGAVRKLPDRLKDMKKKDVKPHDLTTLTLLNKDPISLFVDHVIAMDPKCTGFLASYMSGKDVPSIIDRPDDYIEKVKNTIYDLLVDKKLYSTIEKTAQQISDWSDLIETTTEKQRENAKDVEEFVKMIRKSSRPKYVFEKKTFLIEDLKSIQLRQRHIPPKEPAKVTKEEIIKPDVASLEKKPAPTAKEREEAREAKREADKRTKEMLAFKNSKYLQWTFETFKSEALDKASMMNDSQLNGYQEFISDNQKVFRYQSEVQILHILHLAWLCGRKGLDLSKSAFPYSIDKTAANPEYALLAAIVSQYNNSKAGWQPLSAIIPSK
jgi:hypothetical protein